jgi:NTE family protein
MKIGLALSGGGFRATVFHLGVLARLAKDDRLEEVTFLSTVSGGSLCVALILAKNGFRWPSSQEFLERILPEAHRTTTTQDLQHDVINRALRAPWRIFESRAEVVSELMQSRWGVTARLKDLPETPRWMINATCYESGKNWRFERFRMGDYVFGYSYDTDIPLSDAVAASAGFPGLIGPIVIDTKDFRWFKYLERPPAEVSHPQAILTRKTTPIEPAFRYVHLWDGGVYDNHGLEGLHDFIKGWRTDVDFFIVSDGAGRSKPEAYGWGAPALLRIATGIMMDQIRSLRSRAILERIINHGDRGSFLQAGNTCRYILAAAGLTEEEVEQRAALCLGDEDCQLAAEMPTVIRSLTHEEFERLFRHGFEVADYTLSGYNAGDFQFCGYNSRTWPLQS